MGLTGDLTELGEDTLSEHIQLETNFYISELPMTIMGALLEARPPVVFSSDLVLLSAPLSISRLLACFGRNVEFVLAMLILMGVRPDHVILISTLVINISIF